MFDCRTENLCLLSPDAVNYNVGRNGPFLPRCMECGRGLAMRIICLSLRLSDKRVDCDKTKEKSIQIFIPYE